MEERMQKISKDTCQRKDRAEPEGYVGGQTYMRITENNFTNVDRAQHGLLEEILLLDEATSALDPENEAQIMDCLVRLKETVTIVFVTHKKSLQPYFDKIINLDEMHEKSEQSN